MTLHIVVPVKSLANAKRRLAPVLEAAERRHLSLELLHSVLQVVAQSQRQLGTRGLVISPDSEALDLAAGYGLEPLLERMPPETQQAPPQQGSADTALNAALQQATEWALEQKAAAVLILPADLPLLTLSDIRDLWQSSRQLYAARAMVITPDIRKQGTNALLLRPPGLISYQFGPDSFHLHCRQAQQLGIAWHIHRSGNLALDVDLPSDLERYLSIEMADMNPKTTQPSPEHPLIDQQTAQFLSRPGLLMRLGTVGRDGYPQVTPVWYLYEAGSFYVTTASDRVKARNMLANNKVGFAIDSEDRPYQGLSVWGRARLLAEGEATRDLTRRIAARYVPPERLDAMVDSLMQSPRVLFVIEPVRLAPMGSWQ